MDRNGGSVNVIGSANADDVRAGQYTITPSPDVPAGYSASGRFFVFRR